MSERASSPAGRGLPPGAVFFATVLFAAGAAAGWMIRGRTADVAHPPPTAIAPAPPPPPTTRPDIVLVTVSSLRADHLGVHGHRVQTTPFLAELVRRGARVFDAATAPSSWSLPSAASVLTGAPPSDHGLVRPPRPSGKTRLEIPILRNGLETLAERLAQSGYQTLAVAGDAWIRHDTGLGRGFEDFVNVGTSRAYVVQEVVERFGERRLQNEKPLFAWVHYSDPSAPFYANHWAFAWSPPDAAPELLRLAGAPVAELRRRPVRPGTDVERLQALYDSEIRLVDDHLQLTHGDLGLDDRDLFVVAGLHGEELLDHGDLGHGGGLAAEIVGVPLIVSSPGRWSEPRRIAEPVSLADLAPTLAELAGTPFAVPGRGTSLVPLLEGRPWVSDGPIVAETGRCRLVVDGRVVRTESTLEDIRVDTATVEVEAATVEHVARLPAVGACE